MTSAALLSWIVLGLALQLAVFLLIGWRCHWQAYRQLRQDLAAPAAEPGAGASGSSGTDAGATPAAWAGFRDFRVAQRVMEDAAGTVCSYYLVPVDGQPLPAYLPGQYLTFRLELPGIVEALVRCYSLSDAPQPDHYRISVKRVSPPGRGSGHLHDHVAVGDVLQVRAPAGHFHIGRDDSPLVLIAGGIGITPLLAMTNWVLAEQPGRELWLFYGVRNGRELVMQDHLESLAARHDHFRLRICYSDPAAGDLAASAYARQGRVDIETLRAQLPLKPFHFYLCGPTAMVATLVPALEDWGVADARIHYEAFGPASYGRRKAAAAQELETGPVPTVTFARSGQTVPWQPAAESLLQLAESQGIGVASGCRAGGCGTCQTVIRAGEVSYRQPPDFDPEPGTCLLCVAMPKTDLTLEA